MAKDDDTHDLLQRAYQVGVRATGVWIELAKAGDPRAKTLSDAAHIYNEVFNETARLADEVERLRAVIDKLEPPLRAALVQATGGFRIEDIDEWVSNADAAIEAFEELP